MKNPLRKRLLRELKSELGKYLVIFLLLAGTISLVSGFLVADGSMIIAYNEGFEKYKIEDGNFRLGEKANKAQLKAFWEKHGDIIMKPLDGMGGASIFRVKAGDPNLGVIAETLTELGSRYCMAQNYLPAIKDGDKRVLVVDGEPVPYCLARIPQGGETRGNLAAGGRGEARPLTESDWEIARRVGPTLKAKGLIFVGLDIIGDRLTEINVTSPTCVREIEAAFPDISITGMLMDAIERRIDK